MSSNDNNNVDDDRRCKLICGDALTVIEEVNPVPDNSVDLCLTSPPYWQQRWYGDIGPNQIGIEQDYRDYVARLVVIFGEITTRKLKDTGSIWIVIGDTINGYKRGDINGLADQGSSIGRAKVGLNQANTQVLKTPQAGIPEGALLKIPSKLAIELETKFQLVHRDTVIWNKLNAMPESVMSRFGKSYEEILFFTKKSGGYHFIRLQEPARTPKHMLKSSRPVLFGGRSDRVAGYNNNTYSGKPWSGDSRVNGKRYMRNVWSLPTNSVGKESTTGHFAPFPLTLAERIIQTACPLGGTVLDPFMGSGTTGLAALKLGRRFVGIDLNPGYVELAARRLDRYVNQAVLL